MLTISEIKERQKRGMLTASEVFHLMNEYVGRYRDLAKERGDFIINGEDLGYISTPNSENDKAYHVFMRCKLNEDAAVEAL